MVYFEEANEVKLRIIAPLTIAAVAGTIGFAPIAAAAPGDTTTANDSTVQQSPGNAEVTAHPGAAADQAAEQQQPFGGDMGALLFHNH